MKLENQVCNLELSKKLKELGVKQNFNCGDLCYETIGGRLMLITYERLDIVFILYFPLQMNLTEDLKMKKNILKVFTVAELGEMLPNTISKNDADYFLCCYFTPMRDGRIEFEVSYESCNGKTLAFIIELTEANARAKCLIYLIENKLFKL